MDELIQQFSRGSRGACGGLVIRLGSTEHQREQLGVGVPILQRATTEVPCSTSHPLTCSWQCTGMGSVVIPPLHTQIERLVGVGYISVVHMH